MQMDKDQMEDIWKNKPVGFLKSLSSKKGKVKKQFKLTAKPYIKTYLEPVVRTTYAKNHKKVDFTELRKAVIEMYPTQDKGFGWEMSAEEVKNS
jgi:hypothetical protein